MGFIVTLLLCSYTTLPQAHPSQNPHRCPPRAVMRLAWGAPKYACIVASPHMAVLSKCGFAGLRGIQATGLQRCYQLNASSLTDVLTVAGMPGSKLTCAALSHLPLASWPEGLPSEVGQPGMGLGLAHNPHPVPVGNLQALALNNCQSLTTRGLKVRRSLRDGHHGVASH